MSVNFFFSKAFADWIAILNVAITWISWGAAPGYINIAPLGLEGSYLSYFCFSKSPVCSLLEYNQLISS